VRSAARMQAKGSTAQCGWLWTWLSPLGRGRRQPVAAGPPRKEHEPSIEIRAELAQCHWAPLSSMGARRPPTVWLQMGCDWRRRVATGVRQLLQPARWPVSEATADKRDVLRPRVVAGANQLPGGGAGREPHPRECNASITAPPWSPGPLQGGQTEVPAARRRPVAGVPATTVGTAVPSSAGPAESMCRRLAGAWLSAGWARAANAAWWRTAAPGRRAWPGGRSCRPPGRLRGLRQRRWPSSPR
jgi:hypothetical protein